MDYIVTAIISSVNILIKSFFLGPLPFDLNCAQNTNFCGFFFFKILKVVQLNIPLQSSKCFYKYMFPYSLTNSTKDDTVQN